MEWWSVPDIARRAPRSPDLPGAELEMLAQRAVEARLPSLPACPQRIEHIGVEPEGHLMLRRAQLRATTAPDGAGAPLGMNLSPS